MIHFEDGKCDVAPYLMGADRESNARSPTLQGRIAQLYYAHGLFCSSYPVAVLFFAVLIACLCW